MFYNCRKDTVERKKTEEIVGSSVMKSSICFNSLSVEFTDKLTVGKLRNLMKTTISNEDKRNVNAETLLRLFHKKMQITERKTRTTVETAWFCSPLSVASVLSLLLNYYIKLYEKSICNFTRLKIETTASFSHPSEIPKSAAKFLAVKAIEKWNKLKQINLLLILLFDSFSCKFLFCCVCFAIFHYRHSNPSFKKRFRADAFRLNKSVFGFKIYAQGGSSSAYIVVMSILPLVAPNGIMLLLGRFATANNAIMIWTEKTYCLHTPCDVRASSQKDL